jgi:hypothetical protein
MTDVEDSGGDFTPLPVGVYNCTIDSLELTESQAGNEMIKVTYKVKDGEHAGRLIWDNVVLSVDWKYLQFLKAVGVVTPNGKKRKGEFTLESFQGDKVQVRVKHEADNRPEQKQADGTFPQRHRVQSVNPMPDDIDDDDDEPDATADDGGDEVWSWADLEDATLDELTEINEDEELGVRITSKSKVETVRGKVAEALGVLETETDDDDDDDDDGYDDMDKAALKAEAKERSLSTAGSERTLIRRLRKDDEGDGGEPF